jgi:hypothetical protein
MASEQLKHKIFAAQGITITVNGLPIHRFGFDGDDLIIRAVETLDWEKENHFYYEWIISPTQWEAASVNGNKITVMYEGVSVVDIEIWATHPVDLEEFQGD